MGLTLNDLLALSPHRENSVILNRHLVAFAGSLEAALMLAQVLYWTPRGSLPGGWIAKNDQAFAEELSVSVYSLRKAAERLRAMDLIEQDFRKFNGTPMNHYRLRPEMLETRWRTYIDSLNPQRLLFENAETTLRNHKDDSANPQSGLCGSAESLYKEAETTAEITTETTAHPQPPSPAAKQEGQKKRKGLDDYPDTPGFLRFWIAWPAHKRKVGRKQCRKKWHVANLEPMADQIIAAVEASKRSHDWTKEGGQYIPMPETWLNQGRWEAGAALGKPQGNPDDQLLVPGKDWKPRRLTDEERAALRTLKAPELRIKPIIPEGFVPPPAAQEGGEP